MKILFVARNLHKGGAASGACNLLAALEKEGHELIVLDASVELHKKFILRTVRLIERVFEHLILGSNHHFLRLGPATFDLQKMVKLHRPDIIQLCDVSGNTVNFKDSSDSSVPVVHRLSDFWPYIGSAHYPTDVKSYIAELLHKLFIYNNKLLPDKIVAPSSWLAFEVSRVVDADVCFIGNAVPVNSRESRRPLEPGGLVFGFISKQVLDPRKGFERLVKFLESISNYNINVKIIVYGDIEERNKIFSENISIIYNGPYEKSKISKAYNSFDVLLCPSVYDNSPNVVTEALSFGLPVVGQIKTGIDSYVPECVGFLVDFDYRSKHDLNKFNFAAAELLARYSQFSKSASQYIINNYTLEKIGRKYTDVYLSLL